MVGLAMGTNDSADNDLGGSDAHGLFVQVGTFSGLWLLWPSWCRRWFPCAWSGLCAEVVARGLEHRRHEGARGPRALDQQECAGARGVWR